MIGAVQPTRGLESSSGKAGFDLAAGLGHMAVRAMTARLSLGCPAFGVACETAGHARQLSARGQLELGDRSVALGTLDVAVEVFLVAHSQIRPRDHKRGHPAAGTWIMAEMAIIAATFRGGRTCAAYR